MQDLARYKSCITWWCRADTPVFCCPWMETGPTTSLLTGDLREASKSWGRACRPGQRGPTLGGKPLVKLLAGRTRLADGPGSRWARLRDGAHLTVAALQIGQGGGGAFIFHLLVKELLHLARRKPSPLAKGSFYWKCYGFPTWWETFWVPLARYHKYGRIFNGRA